MSDVPVGKATDHFSATAPRFMRLFMADFGASDLDAAAVFGNAGYESLGFTKLQEMEPTVKGSRGGYGWFQWTGPRRVDFEEYCARNKLDPSSHEANYRFLFVELTGNEKAALPKLKAAKTLETKTVAFEKAFERAGVKAYAKRQSWARLALYALRMSTAPLPDTPTAPETVIVTTPVGEATATEQPARGGFGKLIAAIGSIIAMIAIALVQFFSGGGS